MTVFQNGRETTVDPLRRAACAEVPCQKTVGIACGRR